MSEIIWRSESAFIYSDSAFHKLQRPSLCPARLSLSRHALLITKKREHSVLFDQILSAHLSERERSAIISYGSENALSTELTQVLTVLVAPSATVKASLQKLNFLFEPQNLQTFTECAQYINRFADPRCDGKALFKLEPRLFLVIVNPFSGRKKAMKVYEKIVAPVFQAANIKVRLEITEKRGHCMEIARELELNVYDCVVAVGGDGLLYEIVQGLMDRKDHAKAIRQPLGIVPAGSGNGLAASLLFQENQKFDAVQAAMIIVKGKPRPLDITLYQSAQNESYFSFLSLEWAFIADLDVNSETLRALGEQRFLVKFLQMYYFQRPIYSGTIVYLKEEKSVCSEGEFELLLPPAFEDLERPGKGTMAYGEEESESGTWRAIRGGFRLVWVNNVSHPASSSHVVPGAKLDDGYNYIVFIEETAPRNEMMKLMTGLEEGKHVDSKFVQIVKTRAFQLRSDCDADKFCVDGELVKGPEFLGRVYPGLARIMCL